MKATLQVYDAQSEEPQVFVAELPVTVGRGREAEIRLADWWVSRAHCQIDEVDGSLVVPIWVRNTELSSTATRSSSLSCRPTTN